MTILPLKNGDFAVQQCGLHEAAGQSYMCRTDDSPMENDDSLVENEDPLIEK